jgi:pimeloyl-ACP methyl ester carboxylesterase
LFTRNTPIIPGASNSIASLEKLTIGGVDQWILLRGYDLTKPILLWVHGGPGGAQIGFIRQHITELEKDFLVVNWDQRGAGLSYSSSIPVESMTIDRMVTDLIEVVQMLCTRFHQEKVYLLGHSWGTILSLLAIQRRPELFLGFFSISQVVNVKENERISYEFTLRRSKEIGNEKAYSQLVRLGPPPWNNLRSDHVHNKWLQELGGGLIHQGSFMSQLLRPILSSTEYRLFDLIKWLRGQIFSMNVFKEELMNLDFFQTVREIQVPVAFCCGRHDYMAPSELAEAFYKGIQAPNKQWMWFEKSAHSPIFEEKDLFIHFIHDSISKWQC